jgi:hypothetical protein
MLAFWKQIANSAHRSSQRPLILLFTLHDIGNEAMNPLLYWQRRYEPFMRDDARNGGHEQLFSNGKSAFAKRDKKQTIIDLRGISTNQL